MMFEDDLDITHLCKYAGCMIAKQKAIRSLENTKGEILLRFV